MNNTALVASMTLAKTIVKKQETHCTKKELIAIKNCLSRFYLRPTSPINNTNVVQVLQSLSNSDEGACSLAQTIDIKIQTIVWSIINTFSSNGS